MVEYYSMMAEAIKIFAKYPDSEAGFAVEKNMFLAGPNPKIVSEEDIQTLFELGWHKSEVYECFMFDWKSTQP